MGRLLRGLRGLRLLHALRVLRGAPGMRGVGSPRGVGRPRGAGQPRGVRRLFGRGEGWRFGRRKLSLRARLVVSCVALIAVVAAVIGVVTSVALHSYLEHQVDEQLNAALAREHGRGLQFVAAPGHPLRTVGLRDGAGARSVDAAGARPEAHLAPLDTAQVKALQAVAKDGRPHTVTVPGLGEYRAVARTGDAGGQGPGPVPGPGPGRGGLLYGLDGGDEKSAGGQVVLGFPLAEAQGTVRTLVVVVVCVTLAALVAAGLAGNALVGAALRPLRRIAATATRVSELPLDRGEVALHERVPQAQADPRTEVGQVGAALNRMLGHVGSALVARQESETRVRRFVADASHELRTPLASIRGYAELTRRGREAVAAGPDTRHALGRIESEATRMTGLVEDLLLLARLDAGAGAGAERSGAGAGSGSGAGASLSWESADLVPLVVDAVSDARAAGQDHVWRLELPDEPVAVRGDPARLQQVLVNLLGNARTHTPVGTLVTARVRGASEELGGPGGLESAGGAPGWVLVEVRDDGPGIAPELVGRVFERFARGDVSRARVTRASAVVGVSVGGPGGVQAASEGGGGRVGQGFTSSSTSTSRASSSTSTSRASSSTSTSRASVSASASASTGLGLAIVRAVVEAHGGRVGVESVPGCTVFSVWLPVE